MVLTNWKCLASDAKLDVQAIASTLREEYDGIKSFLVMSTEGPRSHTGL